MLNQHFEAFYALSGDRNDNRRHHYLKRIMVPTFIQNLAFPGHAVFWHYTIISGTILFFQFIYIQIFTTINKDNYDKNEVFPKQSPKEQYLVEV